MVSLDDVEVDYWDGDKMHLKGSVCGMVPGDEICVVFIYPGVSTHHNIPSTVSELQYMYFKGASGDYDLAANGRYIPYVNDGNYAVRIIDVSGTCENWTGERDLTTFLIVKEEEPVRPDLFQYQLIFEQWRFDDAHRRTLLDAEYRKYWGVGGWLIAPSDPDCFDAIRPDPPAGDGISRTGWLCQAIEYGESGCWPLPWWACPGETPRTIYFRGECSCDHFRETLQPLGVPCYHLIKAKNWYGSTVPYCPYIQCD